MSKKCVAFSKSKLGLEKPDNKKAFYAGWDAALREALVEQAEQEPVAWSQQRKHNLIKHWAFDCDWGDLTEREIDDLELIINAVLNAAPVRTKDLTDDELREIHHLDQFGLFCDYDDFEQIARAVIAADREKNK